ncbi:hypothetical protein [Spiroplasma sp. AdecLV25b]|uniref:hypothetical protein n=1 Tax=Spiroplasma sp. AdecLV25b TaxID=3027162 RepID=UPI0027E0104A|nr:hypothetical protein [Spiroplasma sp. AdecLV25b]
MQTIEKKEKNKVLSKSSSAKIKSEIKLVPQWKIFPFVINNGAIGLSETGYKPVNSKITDFGKYELIITGDSPVVVIWKNSTKIYQKKQRNNKPWNKNYSWSRSILY